MDRKRFIINLTQHTGTHEQFVAGVIEPLAESKTEIRRLLTFEALPTKEQIVRAAKDLAAEAVAAQGYGTSLPDKAMIGGAPYLMAALESALVAVGITPMYAFSKRESVEVPDGNGGVRKCTTFRHLGFVE